MPNHGIICAVYGCKNYNTNREFRFHRFPLEKKMYIII